MRSAKRRTSTRRTIAREGGSRNTSPNTSVMKPGVSSSAPPKITSTPSSTSRAGGRPDWSATLKRRHAARPCERMSTEPRMESAIRMAIVNGTPICWPTWMITASSAIGTRMKRISSGTNISPPTLRERSAHLDGDCGLAVQSHQLDQRADLGLRPPQAHGAPLRAQPLREHRQVDHQRRIGAPQLREVDEHVARRVQRGGERTPPARTRRAVLLPRHEQDDPLGVVLDDPGNLVHADLPCRRG